MNCTDVLDQLADYLDDEDRADLCRAIEEHLARCRDCRLEVDTVRKTILLYHAEREVTPSAATLSGLEAVLAQAYTGGERWSVR